MPNINSAGTYDRNTNGLERLAASSKPRVLLFSGTTTGGGATIYYLNDQGEQVICPDGSITDLDLPISYEVRTKVHLEIVFTGSPDCNLTISDGVQ